MAIRGNLVPSSASVFQNLERRGARPTLQPALAAPRYARECDCTFRAYLLGGCLCIGWLVWRIAIPVLGTVTLAYVAGYGVAGLWRLAERLFA